MSRVKVFSSILMVLILITLLGVSVWAAPNPNDEESISGVIQSIAIVDQDGTVTVVVTLVDDSGEIQTVSLSPEAAADLGLVQTNDNGDPILDQNGHPIPNDDMVGEPVDIPDDGGDDDGDDDEEPPAVHPVASALASAFADLLADATGLPYETIMEYHEEGNGFGVIAQACWMASELSELSDPEAGENITPGDILNAKKDHDFSSVIPLSEDGEPMITLPNGEVPTNWGQFRKAVLGNEKAKKNLGAIMSGATGEQEQEQEQVTTTSNKGQGKGKKDKGSDEETVGSSTALPGKGKDKEGGKPDTPPGKEKDKGGGGGNDKGGGGGNDKGGGKGKGKQ